VPTIDDIDDIDDRTAAAAFRTLVRHLQHRNDASNIDLMGLSGFCRNCLADWLVEADPALSKEDARAAVHGMSSAEWKAGQPSATPEQFARMEQSLAKNPPRG
jgi:uncharacterized protein